MRRRTPTALPIRLALVAALLATSLASSPSAHAASALSGAPAARAASLAGVRQGPLTNSTSAPGAPRSPVGEATVPVLPSETPPPGRRRSSNDVLEIAGSLPVVQQLRRANPGSSAGAFLIARQRWEVDYYTHAGAEIAQIVIADGSGRVLATWTGIQATWTMARGRAGAFGGLVSALWIWLPLSLLFLAPFVDWRHPFRLVHVDLLVLLSFSVSLAFFNHALIDESVPLVYPPLIYLLVRMTVLALRGSRRPPLRARVRTRWLLLGLLVLVPARIALNVTDGNVIDVGYAGVIGASRIVHGQPLYGGYPAQNAHGDTYGPFDYEAYVPFEQVFGWSGHWDTLPAAHAAAIAFDLLAIILLFLLGRRVRGPELGVALAYAWTAFPFTLYVLESDSNDTLLAALVLATLLLVRPFTRGAASALAGLAKLAPLVLAPLLAGEAVRDAAPAVRRRALALYAAGFALAAAIACVPALLHDSPATIYARTFGYQGGRDTPFSIWGLYRLGFARAIFDAAVFAAAVLIAFVRRPRGLGPLAAAAAALLIAVQLGLSYWFYLYIPWFFGLVLLALAAPPLAPAGAASGALSARSDEAVAASGSARSHRPSSALGS